jgi:hypothetical protein
MYYNELLRAKIVGQTGEHAIVWQKCGAYLDRQTDVHAAKAQIRKHSSAARNAELKAVRRLLRYGQGRDGHCASLREHHQGQRQGPLGRMPDGRNPDPFNGKPGFAARQPLCGCADARIQRDDEC